ncbi:MAG: hypothetical protein IKK48_02015 [Firmicutes bacterium]|nr:hypothetical protein [Bacillota bacterium]
MKRKPLRILAAAAVFIAAVLLIYPNITIQTEAQLIACRYSDDTSAFETEISADECYVYDATRNVTWSGFDVKKFGPFYVLIFETEPGNAIASKYALDPGYMDTFLARAEIELVEKDYKEIAFDVDDVAALLSGKTPMEAGGRYTCPDYDVATKIYYTLDGEESFMSIYETDGLLVVQVGYPDEGPKFIAYK